MVLYFRIIMYASARRKRLSVIPIAGAAVLHSRGVSAKFKAEVMLMLFKHHGGVHPKDMKAPANNTPISTIPQPPQVVIPMSQHIGAPCTPLVAVGDEVKMGQKIG